MRSIASIPTTLLLAAALFAGPVLASLAAGCSFMEKTFTACGRRQTAAPVRSTGVPLDVSLNTCLDGEWDLYDHLRRYKRDTEAIWAAAVRLDMDDQVNQLDQLLEDFVKTELGETEREEAVATITTQVLELLAAHRMVKRLED